MKCYTIICTHIACKNKTESYHCGSGNKIYKHSPPLLFKRYSSPEYIENNLYTRLKVLISHDGFPH